MTELAGESRGFRTIDDPSARLAVVPIHRAGARVGTIIGGVRLNTYERTARVALIGSIAFATAVMAALAVLVWWALGAALRPVGRMTSLAARWSDESPDERFELGEARDELTRLGATLDGLLDRASAGVRRERRLSAEIAHELRTPVSRIAAEAELALGSEQENSPDALRAIQAEAARLTKIIKTLVATAEGQSAATRGTAAIDEVIDAVLDGSREVRGPEIRVETAGAEALRIGIDGEVAIQILKPIIENALHYCDSQVVIAARSTDSGVEISVADDGQGVAQGEEVQIFQPGHRGRAGASSGYDGAGLGLALARRIARGSDTEILVDTETAGGRFLIRFPSG